MLSSLFMGIGMGASIMISQYYGAKDMERVGKTVSTIYTALMIGIVPLSIIGVVLSRPLLLLIQVPNDGTLDMATVYMITIFAGMIGSLGYNINAGILQGFGDSRTSLLFLLIASVINIILDIVFTAVSYTHLDVYKRQVFTWLRGLNRSGTHLGHCKQFVI